MTTTPPPAAKVATKTPAPAAASAAATPQPQPQTHEQHKHHRPRKIQIPETTTFDQVRNGLRRLYSDKNNILFSQPPVEQADALLSADAILPVWIRPIDEIALREVFVERTSNSRNANSNGNNVSFAVSNQSMASRGHGAGAGGSINSLPAQQALEALERARQKKPLTGRTTLAAWCNSLFPPKKDAAALALEQRQAEEQEKLREKVRLANKNPEQPSYYTAQKSAIESNKKDKLHRFDAYVESAPGCGKTLLAQQICRQQPFEGAVAVYLPLNRISYARNEVTDLKLLLQLCFGTVVTTESSTRTAAMPRNNSNGNNDDDSDNNSAPSLREHRIDSVAQLNQHLFFESRFDPAMNLLIENLVKELSRAEHDTSDDGNDDDGGEAAAIIKRLAPLSSAAANGDDDAATKRKKRTPPIPIIWVVDDLDAVDRGSDRTLNFLKDFVSPSGRNAESIGVLGHLYSTPVRHIDSILCFSRDERNREACAFDDISHPAQRFVLERWNHDQTRAALYEQMALKMSVQFGEQAVDFVQLNDLAGAVCMSPDIFFGNDGPFRGSPYLVDVMAETVCLIAAMSLTSTNNNGSNNGNNNNNNSLASKPTGGTSTVTCPSVAYLAKELDKFCSPLVLFKKFLYLRWKRFIGDHDYTVPPALLQQITAQLQEEQRKQQAANSNGAKDKKKQQSAAQQQPVKSASFQLAVSRLAQIADGMLVTLPNSRAETLTSFTLTDPNDLAWADALNKCGLLNCFERRDEEVRVTAEALLAAQQQQQALNSSSSLLLSPASSSMSPLGSPSGFNSELRSSNFNAINNFVDQQQPQQNASSSASKTRVFAFRCRQELELFASLRYVGASTTDQPPPEVFSKALETTLPWHHSHRCVWLALASHVFHTEKLLSHELGPKTRPMTHALATTAAAKFHHCYQQYRKTFSDYHEIRSIDMHLEEHQDATYCSLIVEMTKIIDAQYLLDLVEAAHGWHMKLPSHFFWMVISCGRFGLHDTLQKILLRVAANRDSSRREVPIAVWQRCLKALQLAPLAESSMPHVAAIVREATARTHEMKDMPRLRAQIVIKEGQRKTAASASASQQQQQQQQSGTKATAAAAAAASSTTTTAQPTRSTAAAAAAAGPPVILNEATAAAVEKLVANEVAARATLERVCFATAKTQRGVGRFYFNNWVLESHISRDLWNVGPAHKSGGNDMWFATFAPLRRIVPEEQVVSALGLDRFANTRATMPTHATASTAAGAAAAAKAGGMSSSEFVSRLEKLEAGVCYANSADQMFGRDSSNNNKIRCRIALIEGPPHVGKSTFAHQLCVCQPCFGRVCVYVPFAAILQRHPRILDSIDTFIATMTAILKVLPFKFDFAVPVVWVLDDIDCIDRRHDRKLAALLSHFADAARTSSVMTARSGSTPLDGGDSFFAASGSGFSAVTPRAGGGGGVNNESFASPQPRAPPGQATPATVGTPAAAGNRISVTNSANNNTTTTATTTTPASAVPKSSRPHDLCIVISRDLRENGGCFLLEATAAEFQIERWYLAPWGPLLVRQLAFETWRRLCTRETVSFPDFFDTVEKVCALPSMQAMAQRPKLLSMVCRLVAVGQLSRKTPDSFINKMTPVSIFMMDLAERASGRVPIAKLQALIANIAPIAVRSVQGGFPYRLTAAETVDSSSVANSVAGTPRPGRASSVMETPMAQTPSSRPNAAAATTTTLVTNASLSNFPAAAVTNSASGNAALDAEMESPDWLAHLVVLGLVRSEMQQVVSSSSASRTSTHTQMGTPFLYTTRAGETPAMTPSAAAAASGYTTPVARYLVQEEQHQHLITFSRRSDAEYLAAVGLLELASGFAAAKKEEEDAFAEMKREQERLQQQQAAAAAKPSAKPSAAPAANHDDDDDDDDMIVYMESSDDDDDDHHHANKNSNTQLPHDRSGTMVGGATPSPRPPPKLAATAKLHEKTTLVSGAAASYGTTTNNNTPPAKSAHQQANANDNNSKPVAPLNRHVPPAFHLSLRMAWLLAAHSATSDRRSFVSLSSDSVRAAISSRNPIVSTFASVMVIELSTAVHEVLSEVTHVNDLLVFMCGLFGANAALRMFLADSSSSSNNSKKLSGSGVGLAAVYQCFVRAALHGECKLNLALLDTLSEATRGATGIQLSAAARLGSVPVAQWRKLKIAAEHAASDIKTRAAAEVATAAAKKIAREAGDRDLLYVLDPADYIKTNG